MREIAPIVMQAVVVRWRIAEAADGEVDQNYMEMTHEKASQLVQNVERLADENSRLTEENKALRAIIRRIKLTAAEYK